MIGKLPFHQFFASNFFKSFVTIGAVSLTGMKYPIGEKLEVLTAFGESYASWEFAFQVSDLLENSLTVPLPDGTKITETNEAGLVRTFQATPFKGQPHYRWVDPDQTILAIRCKEVPA